MFGWRRKRDGFEWHEYVRTTILLRRANRRRKVDAVREAAIDGIKDAGRAAASGLGEAKARAAAGLREAGEKGASAGSAGMSSLGAAAAGAFRAARAGVASAASGAGAWLARGKAGAGDGRSITSPRDAITAIVERAADGASRLVAPSRAVPIGAVGVLLAIAAVLRAGEASWTVGQETLLLAASAFVLIAFALLLTRASHGNGGLAAPPALLQSAAMLGWGGAAAAVVLGIGPLLSNGSDSKPQNAASTPAARQTLTTGSLDTGSQIIGLATALTGDTMRVGGRLVRLSEIEAPELAQSCKREGGRSWRCGELAKRALAVATGRDRISCAVVNENAEGASIATCRTPSGSDLAADLVRGGHVFADSGFFASYTAQQDEARQAKRGLWSGENLRPEAFRTERWDAAVKSAPGGCPVKGLVNGRTRTYAMPWEAGYSAARVRKERGGRWFCSEDEAKAAGWKAAAP